MLFNNFLKMGRMYVSKSLIRQKSGLPGRSTSELLLVEPDSFAFADLSSFCCRWISGVIYPFCVLNGSPGPVERRCRMNGMTVHFHGLLSFISIYVLRISYIWKNSAKLKMTLS